MLKIPSLVQTAVAGVGALPLLRPHDRGPHHTQSPRKAQNRELNLACFDLQLLAPEGTAKFGLLK